MPKRERVRATAIAAAAALMMPIGAAAQEAAKAKLDCLTSTWRLDDAGLEADLAEAFSQSQSGTEFELGGISGNYFADIDPIGRSVQVRWDNWTMTGRAKTRGREFDVEMVLQGTQSYELTSISQERMTVALTNNGVSASVTFGGMSVPNATVQVPPFRGGAWSCKDDTFKLQPNRRTWVFQRQGS